jgi:hypothetical protein
MNTKKARFINQGIKNPMRAVKISASEVNEMLLFFDQQIGRRRDFEQETGVSRVALFNFLKSRQATPRVIEAVRNFMVAHSLEKIK